MELVEGTTLADRIRRGPLPVADALRIARDMAAALVQLKELGIARGEEEERETMETLRAAAMTYVVSAASAAGFVLFIGLNFFRAVGRGRVSGQRA